MAAMLLVILVIGGVFSLALGQFIELLEEELLHRTLARELQQFADRYASDPGATVPQGAGLTGYVVSPGRRDTLPPALAGLQPGLNQELPIGDAEFFAGRKDVGDAQLYLVMDIAPVEELEAEVLGLALVIGLLAPILALLMAVVLSRVVMTPVSRLAELVTQLNPQQRGVSLRQQFGDREIGQIAAALDSYLERLDAFIEREQSFTEDASHELRTPLATILSATQLLQDDPQLPPRAHERLNRIRRAAGQMQSLLEALLFLAREEGGVAMQDCALDEILRESVDNYHELAKTKSVTVDLEAEPVIQRVAPGMAACVVNNLLLNAIHHTGHGRIALRLTAAALTVQDTGAGIAPEDLSRIFERHFRGPQSRGLGLGLYLVQRICERLGWTVRADSPAEGGARLVVSFSPRALTKP